MATEALLDLLDFQKAIRKIRARPPSIDAYKAKADPKFEVSKPSGRKFTEDEEALLVSMARYCMFHRVLVNESTAVLIRTPYPPLGYAGIYHGLTPFDPQCFYSLFYGCAILKIECERQFIGEWASALNALIPDKSPNPPSFLKKDPVDGPWYPGLGRGGWIAVSESVSADYDQAYALVVVCSMDPTLQEELHILLGLLWKAGANVQEFYLKTKWFRDYMTELKRRILYLVVNHLKGISAPRATINKSTILDTGGKGLTSHGYQVLRDEHLVVDPEKLPTSYRLPPSFSVTHQDPPVHEPRVLVEEGEQPISEAGTPDKHEQEEQTTEDRLLPSCYESMGLVPDIDLTFDDCIPCPHDKAHFIRLSGCCELKGKVARIEGPTYPIKVFEIAPETDGEPLLHAFPALVAPNPRYQPAKAITNTCLGDSSLLNYHGKFPTDFAKNAYGDKPIESLRPIFVRYSALDLYPVQQRN